ncbi:MAG TPA: metallophosphoesterase [Burkholderiales bacterium]|nr:metallophosphoesterase [Burkholderiales bacterium]
MRIRVFSDLHLEMSGRHPPWTVPQAQADVVVLAGDIHNGTAAVDWAEGTFAGQPVLYVPGNHEYYDGEYHEVARALRDRTANSNVRVLDNAGTVIEGVRFLGSTLWTDFELFGAQTRAQAIQESLKYVVDFRAIRFGADGLFTPEHSLILHREARAWLAQELRRDFPGKTVVITHHAPHPGSVHPKWGASLTSAAFVSDLPELLGRPALWIHGHTHDGFDYTANGTRVLANPMGYRTSNWRQSRDGSVPAVVTYENPRFDPALVVEV